MDNAGLSIQQIYTCAQAIGGTQNGCSWNANEKLIVSAEVAVINDSLLKTKLLMGLKLRQ